MMRLLMVVTMTGAVSLLAGLWIPVKATIAQQLLNIAWSESQANQTQARPWPWADTWPVGRLRLPGAEDAMVILEGAHGESLAFGPAHLSATPLPGESGTVVIAGHRDTHFHALKTIKTGDPLAIQGKSGEWRHYRVSRERIVDAARKS